jgi:hypothetical protein
MDSRDKPFLTRHVSGASRFVMRHVSGASRFVMLRDVKRVSQRSDIRASSSDSRVLPWIGCLRAARMHQCGATLGHEWRLLGGELAYGVSHKGSATSTTRSLNSGPPVSVPVPVPGRSIPPYRPSAEPVAFFGHGHGHVYGCLSNSVSDKGARRRLSKNRNRRRRPFEILDRRFALGLFWGAHCPTSRAALDLPT